ncbi:Leu/Phe/Val dehydrogenase [Estrella lausannensis]|uniref:Glutamate dehydrogenase/leucine dehydrogenase n=1 Tax=Estrella lausannensis TaxID=483423 RepID=A0A0H5E6T3_9BACT|nr:Glu/Leu/Phe/Val dehydrogenase dimerization domain-containing protein [Estrella lausannensis]CRX39000.1 Glutamate dehydrogenase/leucine dehydrogenase [Estrella lausannensis]
MLSIKEHLVNGYETVIEAEDRETNLHCFIAIHNTHRGPALGGVRIYPYKGEKEALEDVLRLSRAMTAKSSLAELSLGGGKSVIIADPKKDKTPAMLRSFGEVINSLKGSYIVAEDVGSSAEDMLIIREKTPYVVALPTERSSGDPSPFTAFGVLKGMEAAAKKLFGSASLLTRAVAIQGLGHVGHCLAEQLFWAGAKVYIADIDEEKARHFAKKWGAIAVSPSEIHRVPCDIFSPCALGGVLNPQSIKELNCLAVVGSANNQLLSDDDDKLLFERKILYAPDFIINAGGLINVSEELSPMGYNPANAISKIRKIFDTATVVFYRSEKEKRGTGSIALELAMENLKKR